MKEIVLLSLLLLCGVSACDLDCHNGAVCTPAQGEFYCKCPEGFVGKLCEIAVSPPKNCSNYHCYEGICNDDDGVPKCQCPIWTSGDRCQFSSLLNCPDFKKCTLNAANGVCDPECNNPQCMFDFGDCEGQLPDSIATIVAMSPKEFKEGEQRIKSKIRQITQVSIDILKNEETGHDAIYEYDPEQKATFGLVDPNHLEGNFTSVKVVWSPTESLNYTELLKQTGRIVDYSKVFDLPIPSAVVQGPMRRAPPQGVFGLTLFLGCAGLFAVVVVAALVTGYVQRKTASQVVYSTPETPFLINPNWKKGATDISAAVSAFLNLHHEEPLLSDMMRSNDEDSLLQRVSELSSLDAQNSDGLTAVAIAVDRHFVRLQEEFLKRGADPNIADFSQRTPLHRAVLSSNTVAVSALLSTRRIGNVDAVDSDNCSALMLYAKFVFDAKMGRLLLGHGARLSFSGLAAMMNFQRRTALHFAAQSGNVAAIVLFSTTSLESGDKFEVNAVDIHGKTPLIVAAEYGNGQACEELIRLGADKSVEDDMKKTAEIYAHANGFSELADYLSRVPSRPQKGRKRPSGESLKGADQKRPALQELNSNTLLAQQTVHNTQYPQHAPQMNLNPYLSPEPSPYPPSYYTPEPMYAYFSPPSVPNYCTTYQTNPFGGFSPPPASIPVSQKQSYLTPNFLPAPSYPPAFGHYGASHPILSSNF
ncbi:hypothetical protein QR680_016817 [Steinernema hermaphroditum]|uniref:EGF-like domain-containing protein n=1 Tax=Steinernema hermaphroditum TaxID=289476 RepID=A0AA39HDC5_9BILA|nr:hypothetical protein QR680_016817 [Steinernema hermaphroditum]